MGININVPKTIQQNTPLRGVRSGATAEPDDNVKYVPQSLTDAQKAQARQNIGAGTPQVQADWNQADTTAPDYIKNKPESLGGNAAELDKYWIVYPEGNTTISLHAGTINKVWMDGEEIEAVSDVYSVNAFSVVRIDATANASFIFNNTTDPIWLWSPAGVTVNEPVYGTHYNVNLVNRNGGGSNLNFSGKVWLMSNKITPSMFDMTTETRVTKSPRIYLNDTPVDLSALTETPDLANCPTLFYIPQKRFEEFKDAIYTKFGNTFFNDMKCHWVVYEQLVQEDFKFRFILYSDPNEAYCYLKIYQDSSNSIKYTNRWAARHCVGVYRNGLFEDPEHLMSIRSTEGGNRTASVDNTVNLTFGENLLIFNRYDSTEVFVVNDTEWNNYTIPTWMYVKNFEGNPLVSDWTPDKLNVVYENGATKLQSFGHNGGGTSYIYLNNNTISDGRMYLVNNNVVVFTNQSMSGVSKGSQTGHWQWGITQASDVKATIYCPRSRYDELVARYETLYATEIAGGTFDITWITDHIVKYDYIEDVDYRKKIVIMEQAQSDWNQSDTTAPDYIKNKPTITTNDIPDEYRGVWKIHFQIPGSRQSYADWSDNLSRVINTWQRGVEKGSSNRRLVNGWNEIQFIEDAREHVGNFDMSNDAINANILIKTYEADAVMIYNFNPSRKFNGKVDVFIYPIAGRDNRYWKTWGAGTLNAHNVKFYCMTNVWPAGWDEIYADIVYVDGVDFTAVPDQTYTVPSSLNTPGIWVPNSKKAEYLTFLATTYPNEDVSVFTNNTYYYDFITWIDDHTPQVITLPSLALTMTDANGNTIDGDFVAQNITITPAV